MLISKKTSMFRKQHLLESLYNASVAYSLSPCNLEHAPDIIKSNKYLLMGLFKQHVNGFEYTSSELKNDREFVNHALSVDPEQYRYIGEKLIDDERLLLLVLDSYPRTIKYTSLRLQADLKMVFKALKGDYKLCKILPREVQTQKKMFM